MRILINHDVETGPSKGDKVAVMGYENRPGQTVEHANAQVIVVKMKGYTYNPGSRNSLLKGRMPTRTVIYQIDELTGRREYDICAGAEGVLYHVTEIASYDKDGNNV